MRRLMVAAALAALCATSAACADSGESPEASASGGATAATAAATTAAGTGNTEQTGNTKQICADAEKVVTDATTKFSQALSKVLADAASGSDADAVKPIKALFTEWADGLRELAGRASDGQLKSALNDAAEQIGKVPASIKSTADLEQADKLLDSPQLQAAEQKFEKFCG